MYKHLHQAMLQNLSKPTLKQQINSKMMTPIKLKNRSTEVDSADTAPHTQDRTYSQGNLKQRIISLMNENAQLKGREKILTARIEDLEYREEKLKSEVQEFLAKIKCTTLGQARQLFVSKNSYVQPKNINYALLADLISNIQINLSSSNVINQTNQYYSSIIQSKFSELQSKYEQQMTHLCKENKRLSKQNNNLRQNNKIFEDANSKLRDQLSSSIEKFQSIEAIVDQKLNFYVQKIKEYEQIIKRQKSEAHQFQFSFGRDSFEHEIFQDGHKIDKNHGQIVILEKQQIKTENDNSKQKSSDQDLSAECYRASIEGLLEQNRRLKKSFQTLYRMKQGQQLPGELLKEINIMNSIIQLNQNLQNNQEN